MAGVPGEDPGNACREMGWANVRRVVGTTRACEWLRLRGCAEAGAASVAAPHLLYSLL